MFENISIILLIISAIIGYLLGSISFATIIVKKVKGIDIKEVGSGNAGVTNVFRAAGLGVAFVTLLLDFLKGTLSVLIPFGIGKIFNMNELAIYMVCGGILAVIGHIYPVFFKFKGGKGVATYLGVILAINQVAFGITILFMLVIIIVLKMVSVASLLASILIPILIIFLKSSSIVPDENLIFFIATIILSLIIALKHKSNIARIKNGEENKINLFKGKA